MTVSDAMKAGVRENSQTEFERLAARHERESRGDSGNVTSAGDSVSISETARDRFRDYRAAALPASMDESGGSMGAVTRNGALVELRSEAVRSGKIDFSHFGERDKTRGTVFTLAGQGGAPAADFVHTLTITSKNGAIQQHVLRGDTMLTEDKEGNIKLAEADGKGKLNGSDDQDIMINLTDGGVVNGNGGDDIIFNLGLDARVNGGDGNDQITNIGNGAKLNGDAGDDAITVLRDTLHPFKEDMRRDSQGNPYVVGREHGQVEVDVDGGDGNDSIFALADLYKSRVSGGNGDDVIDVGNVVESSISGGDGNDSLSVRDMRKSSVFGGAGNDRITVNGLIESSEIQGGGGDDTITINARKITNSVINGGDDNDLITIQTGMSKGGMSGSEVLGGAGDDLIRVQGSVGGSLIDAGSGNDTVLVQGQVSRSLIKGGEGDDRIDVDKVSESVIDGGPGDDRVSVGESFLSQINDAEGNNEITVARPMWSSVNGLAGEAGALRQYQQREDAQQAPDGRGDLFTGRV